MRRVSFTAHNALTQWQSGPFSLCVVASLIAIAYWYLQADWALASRGRAWPRHRTAAFLAGLVAVDLAVQSPVATFTGSYFQAHVIQHLLLMVVAPPLLALGAPSTLLLQTASRSTKVRWLAVLRSRAFAVLTHPVPVWGLYFGFMFAFFLSSLINTAMLHMWLMDIINLIFLLGGCLYWWPMVGTDPIVHWKMGYGARMLNVLLGAPPEVILGLAILSARQPIASMYSLSSTHAGGALLWVSTEFATMAGFAPIFWRWMRSDERAAARADARLLGPQPALAAATRSAPAVTIPEFDELSNWQLMWVSRTGILPNAQPDGSIVTKPRLTTMAPTSPRRVIPARPPEGGRRRRWPQQPVRWVLLGLAAVAIAAVAGPAVFFHLIEGSAPAQLRLPPATGAGDGPVTVGPVSGTWAVTTGSQAGYRVQEMLFGQHHEAVGRTTKVSGGVVISGTEVSAADFSVDMASIKSDQRSRDAQFDGFIMETYKYRTAHFHLTAPVQLGAIPPTARVVTAAATGQLTLRGVTRSVTFNVQAERVNSRIDIDAEIPVTFKAWHIPNPSFAVAQVGDTGVIEVLLALTPQTK